MFWLQWFLGLLQAAPLKGYRVQVLGIATALSGIISAVAGWSVGDMSFADAFTAVGNHWPVILSGFTLWFGGDKVNALMGAPTLISLLGWFHPKPVVVTAATPASAVKKAETAGNVAAKDTSSVKKTDGI